MTVEEMLLRISALEIAEWQAFERAFGPIGREYADNTLADIHEQLQVLVRLTGEQYEDNPAPMPKRHLRPPEVMRAASDDDDAVSREEFDTEF